MSGEEALQKAEAQLLRPFCSMVGFGYGVSVEREYGAKKNGYTIRYGKGFIRFRYYRSRPEAGMYVKQELTREEMVALLDTPAPLIQADDTLANTVICDMCGQAAVGFDQWGEHFGWNTIWYNVPAGIKRAGWGALHSTYHRTMLRICHDCTADIATGVVHVARRDPE